MGSDTGPTITAQVLLRPASGRALTSESMITAETIDQYRPAPEDVNDAVAAFRAAGFDTGHPVGIGFALIGPRSTFERFFRTEVREVEGGGYGAFEGDVGHRELPLSGLPPDLARRVVAVTFEPPATLFGPETVERWV